MPLLHGDDNYERKLRPVYDALDARSWKVSCLGTPMRVHPRRRHCRCPPLLPTPWPPSNQTSPSMQCPPHVRLFKPPAASCQAGRCGAEEVQGGPAGSRAQGLCPVPQRQAGRGPAGAARLLSALLLPWRGGCLPEGTVRQALSAGARPGKAVLVWRRATAYSTRCSFAAAALSASSLSTRLCS